MRSFPWFCVALGAAGCASEPGSVEAPHAPRDAVVVAAPSAFVLADPATGLEGAVLAASAELEAATEAVSAAQGRADQAGRWPNPRLRVEAREVPRGPFDPSRGGTWVELSQALAPGGRIAAAAAAAKAESAAAEADVDLVRDRVRADLRRVCADVVAAVTAERIAAESDIAATAALAATRALADGGNASASDVAAAVVEAERAHAELRRRRADIASSRAALPPGVPAECDLDAWLRDPRSLGVASPGIERALRPARAREEAARRRVDEARAGRIPDIDVTIAAGRAGDPDEGYVEAGVSIPLPVFDRNGGRIREAEALARAAAAEVRRVTRDLDVRRRTHLAALGAARADADALRDVVLPALRDDFQRAQRAFDSGTRPAIDVAAARRRLAASELALVEAERAARRAEADLIELLGYVPATEVPR